MIATEKHSHQVQVGITQRSTLIPFLFNQYYAPIFSNRANDLEISQLSYVDDFALIRWPTGYEDSFRVLL